MACIPVLKLNKNSCDYSGDVSASRNFRSRGLKRASSDMDDTEDNNPNGSLQKHQKTMASNNIANKLMSSESADGTSIICCVKNVAHISNGLHDKCDEYQDSDSRCQANPLESSETDSSSEAMDFLHPSTEDYISAPTNGNAMFTENNELDPSKIIVIEPEIPTNNEHMVESIDKLQPAKASSVCNSADMTSAACMRTTEQALNRIDEIIEMVRLNSTPPSLSESDGVVEAEVIHTTGDRFAMVLPTIPALQPTNADMLDDCAKKELKVDLCRAMKLSCNHSVIKLGGRGPWPNTLGKKKKAQNSTVKLLGKSKLSASFTLIPDLSIKLAQGAKVEQEEKERVDALLIKYSAKLSLDDWCREGAEQALSSFSKVLFNIGYDLALDSLATSRLNSENASEIGESEKRKLLSNIQASLARKTLPFKLRSRACCCGYLSQSRHIHRLHLVSGAQSEVREPFNAKVHGNGTGFQIGDPFLSIVHYRWGCCLCHAQGKRFSSHFDKGFLSHMAKKHSLTGHIDNDSKLQRYYSKAIGMFQCNQCSFEGTTLLRADAHRRFLRCEDIAKDHLAPRGRFCSEFGFPPLRSTTKTTSANDVSHAIVPKPPPVAPVGVRMGNIVRIAVPPQPYLTQLRMQLQSNGRTTPISLMHAITSMPYQTQIPISVLSSMVTSAASMPVRPVALFGPLGARGPSVTINLPQRNSVRAAAVGSLMDIRPPLKFNTQEIKPVTLESTLLASYRPTQFLRAGNPTTRPLIPTSNAYRFKHIKTLTSSCLCLLCKQEFLTNDALNVHLASVHSLGKQLMFTIPQHTVSPVMPSSLSCHACRITFKSPVEMSVHLANHAAAMVSAAPLPAPVVLPKSVLSHCSMCGRAVVGSLLDHLRIVHSITLIDMMRAARCQICQVPLPTLIAFEDHMVRKHNNMFPTVEVLRGMVTALRTGIPMGQLVVPTDVSNAVTSLNHIDDIIATVAAGDVNSLSKVPESPQDGKHKHKRFKCVPCNERFSTQDELDVHCKKAHRFQCTRCLERFNLITHRDKHFLSVHRYDRDKCILCGESVPIGRPTVRHMKRSHLRSCTVILTRLSSAILAQYHREDTPPLPRPLDASVKLPPNSGGQEQIGVKKTSKSLFGDTDSKLTDNNVKLTKSAAIAEAEISAIEEDAKISVTDTDNASETRPKGKVSKLSVVLPASTDILEEDSCSDIETS